MGSKYLPMSISLTYRRMEQRGFLRANPAGLSELRSRPSEPLPESGSDKLEGLEAPRHGNSTNLGQ